MTLFEGNLPQNEREREQKKTRTRKKIKERKRAKERKKASELDAKCYGNRRKQGTTG